jgi:hypothetical protein
MASDLVPVAERVAEAAQAVLEAWQRARAAGQVERVVSLNLVLRSQSDALLALTELLESEAPRTRALPRAAAPRVGGGCGRPRRAATCTFW